VCCSLLCLFFFLWVSALGFFVCKKTRKTSVAGMAGRGLALILFCGEHGWRLTKTDTIRIKKTQMGEGRTDTTRDLGLIGRGGEGGRWTKHYRDE